LGIGFSGYSNEGDSPSSRGDNSESKNTLKNFKYLLQNQKAKFNQTGANFPWMKGVQVCSIKGTGPL
jgi:hypothetical protein